MLIFDRFPSQEIAETLLELCKEVKIECYLCQKQEDSDHIDPFPYTLYPPIVLIERGRAEWEKRVIGVFQKYGARFAGT